MDLRQLRQSIRVMSVADAAREIDGDGDAIVVFRDVETAAIGVLVRRGSGELTFVQMDTSH